MASEKKRRASKGGRSSQGGRGTSRSRSGQPMNEGGRNRGDEGGGGR